MDIGRLLNMSCCICQADIFKLELHVCRKDKQLWDTIFLWKETSRYAAYSAHALKQGCANMQYFENQTDLNSAFLGKFPELCGACIKFALSV
jgi:hypothetical protein